MGLPRHRSSSKQDLSEAMTRRYIRDKWYATTPAGLNKGDYVLATKYRDGDPADHFCIGYHDRTFDHFGHDRHLVVDADGNQFRANGFRRIALISSRRGSWMVRHFAHIERMQYRFSVWHWYHAPWAELDLVEAVEVVPA
jgi:hypothetical protein